MGFYMLSKYKKLIMLACVLTLIGCSNQRYNNEVQLLDERHAKNEEATPEVEKNGKRIGILTSGGDCSGLNSIIYAVYQKAKKLGYDVVGFKYGVHGVIHNQYIVLDDKICNTDILQKSGTILKSNTKVLVGTNGKLLSKSEADYEIIKRYHDMKLDGLIYIGGNGSIGAIKNILKKDPTLNIIGVPKTIDNDIAHTDAAVGFATVTEVVSEAIDNIASTAQSHERVFVVEVMGRDAGYIALTSGLATGADAILIPENKYDTDKLIEQIKKAYAKKKYAIVVVSESVESEEMKHKANKLSDALSRRAYGGIAKVISTKLKQAGLDSKSVILGHIQRGGKTSVVDRVLGQKLGVKAVKLINAKDCGYLLGYHNHKVIKTKMNDIKTTTRSLSSNDDDIKLANDLGIYIGN